jgi:ribosomal protein L11 methylase PrmA
MILAGIIEAREPELCDYLADHGLRVVRRLGQGDWVSLTVSRATE